MKTTSKLFLSLSAVLCVSSSLDATLSCGDHESGEGYPTTKSTAIHRSQIVPFDGSAIMLPTHIPLAVVEKPVPPTMSRDSEPNTKMVVPSSLQSIYPSQIVPFDGSAIMLPTHIPLAVVEKPVPPTMSRDSELNTKMVVPSSLQSSEAARERDPSLPTGILIVPESLMNNEFDFFEGLRRRNAASVVSQQEFNRMQQESKISEER